MVVHGERLFRAPIPELDPEELRVRGELLGADEAEAPREELTVEASHEGEAVR